MITEELVYREGLPRRLGRLIPIRKYRARFANLVTLGWYWTTVHCVGVLGDMLVVYVELPQCPPDGARFTSVNVLGPTCDVAELGFRLGGVVESWEATDLD